MNSRTNTNANANANASRVQVRNALRRDNMMMSRVEAMFTNRDWYDSIDMLYNIYVNGNTTYNNTSMLANPDGHPLKGLTREQKVAIITAAKEYKNLRNSQVNRNNNRNNNSMQVNNV